MPEQNDPAKETSEPWEGWRSDPISEPVPGWSIEVHEGPSFTFTSPDGQKYTVNGPDGATCEQAFSILQDWRRGNQKAEPPSEEHGPWENYAPLSVAAGEDYAAAGATSAGEDRWRKAPMGEPFGPWKVDPDGVLTEFEAAMLEEVIAEVDSAEFLADLLVFEHGKPDPRICTEAGWAASGFDRFLHGPH